MRIVPRKIRPRNKLVPYARNAKTFSDFPSIIITSDRGGLNIAEKTTYSRENNRLMAHLNLDLVNTQLASFMPAGNETNENLETGLTDEKEYEFGLEDILITLNVLIPQRRLT